MGCRGSESTINFKKNPPFVSRFFIPFFVRPDRQRGCVAGLSEGRGVENDSTKKETNLSRRVGEKNNLHGTVWTTIVSHFYIFKILPTLLCPEISVCLESC
jgi:hypothetical protein